MNESAPFMAAAHYLGYSADPSFVFILFSVGNTRESRPWDANYDGTSYPYLRAAYEGAFILRVAGLDYGSINTFRRKLFASQNLTNPSSIDSTVMPMYDAVFLYGVALNKSLTATKDENVYMNGSLVFQYMKNIEFAGITSQVLINNDGERIPSYQFVRIPKNVDRTYTVLVEIEANRATDCDPTILGNLCYPFNTTVTYNYLAIVWPPDEPVCGYSDQLCDQTLFYVLGGVILGALLFIALIYYAVKKKRESRLYLMPWQVPLSSVKLLASGTVVSSMISMTSLRDSTTSVNSKTLTTSLQQALVGNTRASVRRYKQLKRISFDRRDLNSLYHTKQASHDNLNSFVGLTYNNLNNECLFFWKLCTRGSLQDIVANEDLKLDMDFKASFISDIVKGMLFLHSSNIKEHGTLRSSNCLVDNHWTVKLTDYGVNRTITDLLKHREIQYTEEGVQEPTPNKLLYMAPEHLRTFLSHRRIEVSQAGDIYAIGIIMHEILYRMEPYSDSDDTAEGKLFYIIQKVASLDATTMRAIRPSFPRDSDVPSEVVIIIQQCWSESADQRPNIKRIKKVTDSALRTSSGTITEHMIKMMEDYAGNLEKIVHERTAMLEETQLQAEGLLLQMLPKSVAQDLKLGRHVAPQTYEEATVLFSDIAGFTTLCSSSGPLEIVAFLNGIFSGFDAIIAEH
uniref:guanylate cyclase n=1 Tax=Plectus sambesii TaxID=2011161 RepID=A0A914XIN3_9BILA